MKNLFKRMLLLLIMVFASFAIVGCVENKPQPEPPIVDTEQFTVTFDSQGGTEIPAVKVDKDSKVGEPVTPVKEGFEFEFWYLEEGQAFDFTTPITSNITLKAAWVAVVVELTTQQKMAADFEAIKETFIVDKTKVNVVATGPLHKSRITWSTQSPHISNAGVILPLLDGQASTTGIITGTFRLGGEIASFDFEVPINAIDKVVLHEKRTLNFENTTTEYTIADSTIDLWFTEGGSVPYVNVENFFNLVKGFIDPAINITFQRDADGIVTIAYDYYDADVNHTYHLTCIIDPVTQTITTPDPGFYWAYVYSTETNYGRNIEYLDHQDESSVPGTDLIYNLKPYNLEMVVKGNETLLPFNLVNQLFAGSSYYNVYYNGDRLYGIYSIPRAGTGEYAKIKQSTLNNTSFPTDLVINNFNSLAFYMDNFYGLREHFGINTFYDVLLNNSSSLLSNNPVVYENGLANLLLKVIDELHTSYHHPSYYNKFDYPGFKVSLGALGPRVNNWYQNSLWAVGDAIELKWGSEELRPDYWFLNGELEAKTHAVLTLDEFATSDLYESATFDNAIVQKIMKTNVNLLTATTGTRFFFYNNSSTTNNTMEAIIKGAAETQVVQYRNLLITDGFNEVVDPENILPNRYFKTVNGVEYMALVEFDLDYNVLYIGITDKIPAETDTSWAIEADVDSLIRGDSAVYMEFALDRMFAEAPGITHVTLDISYNTGGNVGALYRVIGFITDQPFRTTSINAGTGSKGTSYIQINNSEFRAGIKWSLLISNVTFSAGNSMATIFKENNLGPVIGLTSGGGTSSITPILLPNGSAFTMSSNSMNGMRIATGNPENPFEYVNNENGITPDYAIEVLSLYNEATLLEILNRHDLP
jgi:hypothetical protein